MSTENSSKAFAHTCDDLNACLGSRGRILRRLAFLYLLLTVSASLPLAQAQVRNPALPWIGWETDSNTDIPGCDALGNCVSVQSACHSAQPGTNVGHISYDPTLVNSYYVAAEKNVNFDLGLQQFPGEVPTFGYWCHVFQRRNSDNVVAETRIKLGPNYCPGGTSDIFSPTGCTAVYDPEAIGGHCSTGPTKPCDQLSYPMVGNPISVVSGNKYESVADYRSSGGNVLEFVRHYNSLGQNGGSMGPGWTHDFQRHLEFSAGSTLLTVVRGDGQRIAFNFGAPIDHSITLTLTSGLHYVMTDDNDTKETYDNATDGRLLSVAYRNGYQQTLSYDLSGNLITVSDNQNRSLSFTYTSAGLLSTMTDPDGRTYFYSYNQTPLVDTNGAQTTINTLSSVTYPADAPGTTPTITYLYENSAAPTFLTGIVDELGNRLATWAYNTAGQAVLSQHAGGADATTIAYNADGTRTVTTALGNAVQYTFSLVPPAGVNKLTHEDRIAGGGIPAANRQYTYDGDGFLASMTDWNGNLRTYVNDSRGQPTTITEASGTAQARTTTISYHPTFHLPLTIVTPGLTTRMTYDANGNALAQTLTDTTTTTVPYATNGLSRTWSYTYDNLGHLLTAQGPRSDVQQVPTFTYDSTGAIVAIQNALGQIIHVTQHTLSGLPQTVVDRNGVPTQFTYDGRQRLLSSTLTTGSGSLTTRNGYDLAGNLTNITLPDGSTQTNIYDGAHRLTGFSDLFAQSVTYALDALGDRTLTKVANASAAVQRQHTANFDALGRLLQDIGGVGQTTAYAYDANGNTLTITDPLNRVTQRAFDPLNRLIRTIDPSGGITKAIYDPHDRPLTVIDPNNSTTTYVYDGFGDLIQLLSPDTGKTVYRYDPAGNLTQKVDATGATTNYAYDALDRVVSKTYPGDPTENVSYTYDQAGHGFGNGRLTTVADAAGTLSRSYDERGNIVSEARIRGAATLLTTYRYDAASRVTAITYPMGYAIAYTRDVMGRTTSVTAQAPGPTLPKTVASLIGYKPFGPVNALTFGNGIAETRNFDLDYRLTGLAAAGTNAVQNVTYGYDLANNVLSIADVVAASNSQSFSYDALDRLTGAIGGYGGLGYSYNNVGNRLTQTAGSASTSYTYLGHSNQLTAIKTGGATQTVAYTTAGNITSFTPGIAPPSGGAAINGLLYNQANQLATVMAGVQNVAQYGYDAFGQRLVKIQPAIATTTLYQYDLNGRLLEESNNQGNPEAADYIYLDDGRPIATLSPGTGNLSFVLADRLGTPQLATDSNQATVWGTTYQPFGQTGNIQGVAVQNLRLPGQYADFETGFSHNGFRDYVPGLGRYLQSDPIGLVGGMNTYGYAEGNPVNKTDPVGLHVILLNNSLAAVLQIGSYQTPPQGHNGVLVGNALLGYTYFSKTGTTINVTSHFSSIDQFFGDTSSANYDRGLLIQTSLPEDLAMLAYATANFNSPYDLLKNNCADLTGGVLAAGGITDPSLLSIPNIQFDTLVVQGVGAPVFPRSVRPTLQMTPIPQ